MSLESQITAGYLAANYVPYTGANANVNLGSFNLTTTGTLTGSTLVSTLASGGAAPMTITSTTKVANLNVDYVDGIHIAILTNGKLVRYNSTGTQLESATVAESSGALSAITTLSMSGRLTNSLADGGDSPFLITSRVVNANLNADLLDGYEANALPYLPIGGGTVTGATTIQGSLSLGKNGVGGVAGSLVMLDGNTPGATYTLSYTELSYIDGLNQSLPTTGTPQFARLGLGVASHATDILTILSADVVASGNVLNISHSGGITGSHTGINYVGSSVCSVEQIGQSITLSGASGTNTCLKLSASGATNNYGLIISAGYLGFGISAPISPVHFYRSDTGVFEVMQDNPNTGTGAFCRYYFRAGGANVGYFGAFPANYVTTQLRGMSLVGAGVNCSIWSSTANIQLIVGATADVHGTMITTGEFGLGKVPTAGNKFDVLQTSTTTLSSAINALHSGSITGTGYGIYSSSTCVATVANYAGYYSAVSASLLNVALYATASGGTGNTALQIGAGDIVLPTSTGTKIGTATTQLLAFYGAVPVDQPATVADAVTQALAGTDTIDVTKTTNDLTSCKNAINAIIDRLQELGLIA